MLGAAVQGSIGFGLGLLAAPVLGIIDPDFLPVTVVAVVIPLGFGVVLHDHVHIIWHKVARDRRSCARRADGYLARPPARHPCDLGGHRGVGAPGGRRLGDQVPFPPSRGTSSWPASPPVSPEQHGDRRPADGAHLPARRPHSTAGDPQRVLSQSARCCRSWPCWPGAKWSAQIELTGLLLPAVFVGLALSRAVIRFLPAARLRPVILTVCSVSAVALLVETYA